jgi:molybdopterin synthase catalytic subunit
MISIQTEDFDLGREYQQLRQLAGDAGAVVTFTGLVREWDKQDEKIESLTLEHYPGMTEKSLQKIVDQANERWELKAIRVIHRVGRLEAAEQIVLVGTASAHRQAAFSAAEFIMDYLKSHAPFWKKQQSSAGSHWVEQRSSDADALNRWRKT